MIKGKGKIAVFHSASRGLDLRTIAESMKSYHFVIDNNGVINQCHPAWSFYSDVPSKQPNLSLDNDSFKRLT